MSIIEKKHLIVAGPCSAETEEQLMEASLGLKEAGVDMLRAGVWKPRTRPNSFEGIGAPALEWIKNVKKATGLPFTIEVATPQHVELALDAGIDVLWIGARTTVNPFNVQDIADALRGVDIPVMIKNPINPDLSLWIGAIERIAGAGIKQIAAIHRGFSTFQPTQYRNLPMWRIPIELKSKMPELPLICDPSHISGKRDMVFEVAQKALDLDYDGLMIEVHPDPDHAWSDPKQQMTPARFGAELSQLRFRKSSPGDQVFIDQLEELREKIDYLDREIIEALGARMKMSELIGLYKKDNNVAAFQLQRWQEILKTRPDWGEKESLTQAFVEEIYKIIHNESVKVQTEIMKKQPSKT